MTLALGTLTTFTFYQLTQKCVSAVTAFACASALILTIGSLALVVSLVMRLASTPDGIDHLFTKGSSYARRWGSLYEVLDHHRIFFMIPILAVVVMRSAAIGFGQRSGLAQVIAIIVLELITCTGEHLVSLRWVFFSAYNGLCKLCSNTTHTTAQAIIASTTCSGVSGPSHISYSSSSLTSSI
jgi:hypothetical protein